MTVETFLAITFMSLLGLLFVFLWLKRKGAPRGVHRMSEEATAEVEGVLGDYRQAAAAHPEPIKDAGWLPHPKEVVREYLQVAIGLARLNREPADRLLEDYYLLAHFQRIEKGDEDAFPFPASDGKVEQKYLARIADETAILERELEVFLKRKKLLFR
jgi:hypothetical protein